MWQCSIFCAALGAIETLIRWIKIAVKTLAYYLSLRLRLSIAYRILPYTLGDFSGLRHTVYDVKRLLRRTEATICIFLRRIGAGFRDTVWRVLNFRAGKSAS